MNLDKRTNMRLFAVIIAFFIFAFSLQASSEPDEAYYQKAWRTYKIGTKKEKDEVIKALKKIVKDDPEQYSAHYYLGVMLSEEGSPSVALNHFITSLDGFPESADIRVRIAQILETRKTRASEALEYYEKAYELDPNNAIANSKLGINLYKREQYKEAHRYLSRAIELEPENVETLKALGGSIISLHSGSTSEAIELLEQALLFNERDAETHWLLAKAYEKSKLSNKAAYHFQRAKALGRTEPAVKEKIGYDYARSLHESNQIDEAIAEYKREISKNDDKATGWSELAQVFEDIGAYENAITAYTKAFETDKSYASGIIRAGDIYMQREDYENAEKMYKMVQRNKLVSEEAKSKLEDLQDLKTRLYEGELLQSLYLSTNKDADIVAINQKMLEIDKNNTAALQDLIDFYEQRGYYSDAISYYRKLMKIKPEAEYVQTKTINNLKEKMGQDNIRLWATKKEGKITSSKVGTSDLKNLARYGENDRLKETALLILTSRRGMTDDRELLEQLLSFYETRGHKSEALKVVTKLKRHGHYNDSQAESVRARIKNN